MSKLCKVSDSTSVSCKERRRDRCSLPTAGAGAVLAPASGAGAGACKSCLSKASAPAAKFDHSLGAKAEPYVTYQEACSRVVTIEIRVP